VIGRYADTRVLLNDSGGHNVELDKLPFVNKSTCRPSQSNSMADALSYSTAIGLLLTLYSKQAQLSSVAVTENHTS